MRAFVAVLIAGSVAFGADAPNRAHWMRQARWGVMSHFLAEWIEPSAHKSVDDWNRMVDAFDVQGLAKQLESAGAPYYLITIGQNSGFYISPNSAYDKIVGIQPSHCSRRDLIADLAEALQAKGIRLMVYLPAGAPARDAAARKALQWTNGAHPNREFQANWELVIREWSLRWGKKVSGWWFDGCYWPNTMYRSANPPNFASFAAAARAGNPASIVGFNPGVIYPIVSMTGHEDYTAGEISDPERMQIRTRRWDDGYVDGAQLHMLSYLGETWGKGSPRFSEEQIIGWTRRLVDAHGAVTWDVPIQPRGHISEPFLRQLTVVGKALRRLEGSQF